MTPEELAEIERVFNEFANAPKREFNTEGLAIWAAGPGGVIPALIAEVKRLQTTLSAVGVEVESEEGWQH